MFALYRRAAKKRNRAKSEGCGEMWADPSEIWQSDVSIHTGAGI